MPFKLPPLPYSDRALEPVISAKTLAFHHGKHHKAYITKLNELLEGEAELAALELEDLIPRIAGDESKSELFNNAAQAWNHAFFWNSMKPKGGGKPTGRMAAQIDAAFGDYEKFRDEFTHAAETQFGSGWAWLIEEDGKLAVVKTADAHTPLAQGKRCLLTLDVWEHAYYLDFQNRRPDYIAAFLDRLANWEFAAKNLGESRALP